MAKRSTGLGSKRSTRTHKTKKRLEIKRLRLIELAKKKRKHNRIPRAIKPLL